MKTSTQVNLERVRSHLRARFNPIRHLTPETLARQLEDFRRGHFREVAQSMDIVEERDDVLHGVASKRKKAAARHGWEVLTLDDSQEASQHREALEYFYNHLTATSAIDENVQGGLSTLIRQMLDALGKKYSVHEIVWQPNAAEGKVSASFRFVPLWFFENITGRLRYLKNEGAIEGVPLQEGGWLVTVSDSALMAPCLVSWMFKRMPLQDWLGFCEKFGIPGLKLKTNATRGSLDWERAVEGLSQFMNDWLMVYGGGEELDTIEVKNAGNLPFEGLIERMDRAMAALWRGADLSTISKGQGLGASLQEAEATLLEQDDAQLITEALNTQVDRYVLKFLYGDRVEPKAYIQIKTGGRNDEEQELRKWETAVRLGVPLALSAFRERFGLPQPDAGEELLTTTKVSATSSNGVLDKMPETTTNGSRIVSVTASNEADVEEGTVGAANALSPGQDGWLLLAPFGDHPHARGLQRFTREAADGMVRFFNSLRGRLARKFGGVPVFIGHPDDPAFANQPGHNDTRAYAWIQKMDARADGLWVLPKWSEAGRAILTNAFYKYLSPRWAMRPLGNGNYAPARLISVGLTNSPNITGEPIANQSQTNTDDTMNELLEKMLTALGFSSDEASGVVNKSEDAPTEDAILARTQELLATNGDDAVTQLAEANEARFLAENQLADLEKEAADLAAVATHHREAHADLLVANALSDGRIAAHEKAGWMQRFAGDEDFETVANALAELKPKIKTEAITSDLGQRKAGIAAANARQAQLVSLVNRRMERTGEDYFAAYRTIKRENPALFSGMHQPEAAAS